MRTSRIGGAGNISPIQSPDASTSHARRPSSTGNSVPTPRAASGQLGALHDLSKNRSLSPNAGSFEAKRPLIDFKKKVQDSNSAAGKNVTEINQRTKLAPYSPKDKIPAGYEIVTHITNDDIEFKVAGKMVEGDRSRFNVKDPKTGITLCTLKRMPTEGGVFLWAHPEKAGVLGGAWNEHWTPGGKKFYYDPAQGYWYDNAVHETEPRDPPQSYPTYQAEGYTPLGHVGPAVPSRTLSYGPPERYNPPVLPSEILNTPLPSGISKYTRRANGSGRGKRTSDQIVYQVDGEIKGQKQEFAISRNHKYTVEGEIQKRNDAIEARRAMQNNTWSKGWRPPK